MEQLGPDEEPSLEQPIGGADTPLRSEFVVAELRKALMNGSIRPGQRLRETDIARWLGVSRTPVREALHRLTEAGLIAAVPPRGMIVVELKHRQVVELYAVRETLEGTAAALAAQHASPAEITSLHTVNDLLARETEPAQLKRLNRRFHRALYLAAHNEFLMRSLEGLADAIALLPGTTVAAPGRPQSAAEEHRMIIAAIERRDSETAERIARMHIREALKIRIGQMFESEQAPATDRRNALVGDPMHWLED
jgi:DNA-binding GntR family transcriptional regulator